MISFQFYPYTYPVTTLDCVPLYQGSDIQHFFWQPNVAFTLDGCISEQYYSRTEPDVTQYMWKTDACTDNNRYICQSGL